MDDMYEQPETDGLGCLKCNKWVCECQDDSDWKARAEKAEAEVDRLNDIIEHVYEYSHEDVEPLDGSLGQVRELKAEVERKQTSIDRYEELKMKLLDLVSDLAQRFPQSHDRIENQLGLIRIWALKNNFEEWKAQQEAGDE